MNTSNPKLNAPSCVTNFALQLPKKNKYSISIYTNPYNINIPFINQPKKQNVSTMYKLTSDKIQNINPQKKKPQHKLTFSNILNIPQTTTAPFNKCINQTHQTNYFTQKNHQKQPTLPAKIPHTKANNNSHIKNYSISITKRKHTLDAQHHRRYKEEGLFFEIEKKIAILKKHSHKKTKTNINNNNNNNNNNNHKKTNKKNSFSISINPLNNNTNNNNKNIITTRNVNMNKCNTNMFKYKNNSLHHERAISFSYRDIPHNNNNNNIKRKQHIKQHIINIPNKINKETINNKILHIQKKGIIPCYHTNHNIIKRPQSKEQKVSSISKKLINKQNKQQRPDSSLSKVKTTDATPYTTLNVDSYCMYNNNNKYNVHKRKNESFVNNSLFDISDDCSGINDSFNDINSIVKRISFSDIDLNGIEEDLFSINKEGIIRYDYNKEFDERFMKQINMKKGK